MRFPKRNIVKITLSYHHDSTDHLQDWVHLKFNNFLFKTRIALKPMSEGINHGRITKLILRDLNDNQRRVALYQVNNGWIEYPEPKLVSTISHLIKIVEDHIEGKNSKNQLELFPKPKRLKFK